MGKKTEISVEEAAKIMHKDAHYLRLWLQQGIFPFGNAVQKPNGRWSYNIIPIKFYEYMGMKEEVCINENFKQEKVYS